MKENVKFPSNEEMKRNEKVMEMSDKYVGAFLKQYYPCQETEDEVTMELGELCAFLHVAFKAGANLDI